MPYPMLPVCDPPADGETLEAYACRVLRFVCATGVTATVPTEALRLADHFYPVSIARPDLLGPTIDRLADVQRLISWTLRYRDQLASVPSTDGTVPAVLVPPVPGGQKVAVLVQPIVRPPGGTYADSRPIVRQSPVDVGF